MARKLVAAYADNIVEKYRAGSTADEVAREFGFGKSSVYRVLKKHGIDARPSAWQARHQIPIAEAKALHDSGVGVGGIAAHFGVAPNVIYRAFREASIKSRSRSEQQTARMQRAGPAERPILPESSRASLGVRL